MAIDGELLRLKELDRAVIRAVMESDVDGLVAAVNEFVPLRQRLRAQMLEESVMAIENEDARSVARSISGSGTLPAEGVISGLLGPRAGQQAPEAFDEGELERLGSELFYSWFSHHEYVTGLNELRPMLLRTGVPEAVSRLVGQARGCFAFQQYDAAYGLCRTVIEASVRDICVRKKLLPEFDQNIIPLERHSWAALRRMVSSGGLEERLRALYADLSVLLHGRRSVARDEARQAFRHTLEVIEDLYASHDM